MTRWKKDETDFRVSVSSNGHTKSCRIPKPILDMLGDPESITFRIRKNRIMVDCEN
ncbi:MAG: hypothetical protein OXC46_11515 [Thaumarchaeota archaeon]|nr:hypothetical protein [Nitrososphaerota archaeon]